MTATPGSSAPRRRARALSGLCTGPERVPDRLLRARRMGRGRRARQRRSSGCTTTSSACCSRGKPVRCVRRCQEAHLIARATGSVPAGLPATQTGCWTWRAGAAATCTSGWPAGCATRWPGARPSGLSAARGASCRCRAADQVRQGRGPVRERDLGGNEAVQRRPDRARWCSSLLPGRPPPFVPSHPAGTGRACPGRRLLTAALRSQPRLRRARCCRRAALRRWAPHTRVCQRRPG